MHFKFQSGFHYKKSKQNKPTHKAQLCLLPKYLDVGKNKIKRDFHFAILRIAA